MPTSGFTFDYTILDDLYRDILSPKLDPVLERIKVIESRHINKKGKEKSGVKIYTQYFDLEANV